MHLSRPPSTRAHRVIAATLCGGGLAAVACGSRAPVAAHPSAPRATAASEWIGVAAPAMPPAATADAPPVAAGEVSPEGAPWVLHVGDSFTEASFARNLAPRFRAAGARYVVDAATSTFTTTWAKDPGFDGCSRSGRRWCS